MKKYLPVWIEQLTWNIRYPLSWHVTFLRWLVWMLVVQRTPIQDDLERAFCCAAGEIGHRMCGWCAKCGYPNMTCRCKISTFISKEVMY